MPRNEWDELLSRSAVRGTSRNEVERELETAASIGSAGILSVGGGASGGPTHAGAANSSSQTTQQMSSLVEHITSLNATEQSAINAIQGNTQAVTQNTSAKSTGTSAASQLGNAAESLFGGALSLSPIVSGIFSLFGGGQSAPATQMMPFMLPAPVEYHAGATSSGGVSPVSYAEGGQPRAAQPLSSTTQVTVQVSAMDSQSFLDHSDQIANAVKTALLNSNSLGDVIGDL
jgi:hypothetical protein